MANLSNSVFNEFFVESYQNKLFADNSFLNYVQNMSEFLEGRMVHVPQYNHTGSTLVDFSEPGGGDYDFDGFASERPGDQSLSFTVESYQMFPQSIPSFEETISAPNRFEAIMSNSIKQLTTNISSRLLYRVAQNVPASNYFLSSGNNGTANGIDGSNDVMISQEDIKRLAEQFDEDNTPEDSRYVILPTKMYYELLNESEIIRADYFGSQTITSGDVPELYGIKILKRSTVLATGTSGNASGADLLDPFTENFNLKNNGQQHVALAFETSSVAAAWKTPYTYTQDGNPFKYGDVVSCEAVLGAAHARSGLDDAGVYLLAHQDV